MIRHIFRLVWNRKRSNLLIWLEILISFLVVFAVVTGAVYYWHNARQPMGFDVTDLWEVYMRPPGVADDDPEGDTKREALANRTEQIWRELRALDAVEAVAVTHYPPYKGWSSSGSWDLGDKALDSERIGVSLDHPSVYGLNLLSGRFFEEGDDQLAYEPVLINRRLAAEAYGRVDVSGETLREPEEDSPPDMKPLRVIGVFDEYRKSGEFSRPKNMTFHYHPLPNFDRPTYFMTMKMEPGTTGEYEETILKSLEALAPTWSFSVTPLEDVREEYLRGRLTVLMIAALVAGFLILMVALGLLGVLWQAVTQRTQEIGVRRAKGADAGRIYQQILGELLGITALALAVGTVLLLQLPLVGWLDFLEPRVTVPAYLISLLFMTGLTAICGLYPSRLASRVNPAEALHYE